MYRWWNWKWAKLQENKPVVSRGNENPVDLQDIW